VFVHFETELRDDAVGGAFMPPMKEFVSDQGGIDEAEAEAEADGPVASAPPRRTTATSGLSSGKKAATTTRSRCLNAIPAGSRNTAASHVTNSLTDLNGLGNWQPATEGRVEKPSVRDRRCI
jgi:hypothetical protein